MEARLSNINANNIMHSFSCVIWNLDIVDIVTSYLNYQVFLFLFKIDQILLRIL